MNGPIKGIPTKEKVVELDLEEIYTHPEKLTFNRN
ncbi:hypothetical protein ES708_06875 [subsurface metagenome]